MNQPYFIVVLAHSLHGRLRRVHIPYQFVYVVLLLALIGGITVVGFVASYARMSLKVANYNRLRQEVDTLRARYQRLETESKTTNQQLASLQLLATEVSVAYGLTPQRAAKPDAESHDVLAPSVPESFAQFNLLKSAHLSRYARMAPLFQSASLPASWPLSGPLMSHFGYRTDPFSSEGAFHAGVDISAPKGTPIRVTGDGTVVHAEWSGAYGNLVVVDHGNGLETYYAHMSRFAVIEGETVRRGDLLGFSGATGRVTAPHLHYEVRRNGAPVNPRPFLQDSGLAAPAKREFTF